MTDREEADPSAAAEAEAQDWLVRLRGDGPGSREAFEDWYVADPRNSAAYERVLETWEAAAHLPRHEAPAVSDRRRRAGWRAAIAAIVLIMLGLGVASLTEVGRSPADAFSIATKVGEIRTDRLPDGTRVTLDTNSRVDAVYTASKRQLRLVRGRVRVTAAIDPKRPMQLQAAAASIADGQTIDLTRGKDQTIVAMIDGSGAVQVGDAITPLSAGQEVAIADDGPRAAPTALRDSDTRWPSGMMAFDDAALGDVVAEANRYSTTRIVLAGGGGAHQRFTGTFRAGDQDGLARMLAAAFHLTLSHGADGTLILGAPSPAQ